MLTRTVLRWTLALVLLPYLHVASAAPPEIVEDARCFVASLAAVQGDSLAQAAAAYYYLGRMDGMQSDSDLKDLIVRVSREMSAGELRSESQRCGRQLAARGQVVMAIGRELQQHHQ